jgi:hypothetical protein
VFSERQCSAASVLASHSHDSTPQPSRSCGALSKTATEERSYGPIFREALYNQERLLLEGAVALPFEQFQTYGLGAVFSGLTGWNKSSLVPGFFSGGPMLPLAVDRHNLRVCFVSASCSLNRCSMGSTNRMRTAAHRTRSERFSMRSFLLTRRIDAKSRKGYAMWHETRQRYRGRGETLRSCRVQK